MSASSRLTATVKAASKRRLIPTRAAITMSPNAVRRIKELLVEKPDIKGLKIGVKTRGCNGLSYTLDYASEKGKFDEEVNQDGAKVFIDSKAQLTLLGTVMDFVEEKLGSEFVFENPNITGFCGCGESFSLAKSGEIEPPKKSTTESANNNPSHHTVTAYQSNSSKT